MKKILWMVLVGLLLSSPLFAAWVNLTKPGTTWVWRVEAEDTDSLILTEAGTAIITEASVRLKLQDGGYFALYHALIGQGWEETSDAANVPQAIEGTGLAQVYNFALAEDDTFLITEASNKVNLER